MPELKERPKRDKPKAKPPAVPAKQAARMVREKYLQQLDQRRPEEDGETSRATDQVEGAGRWATDEAAGHTPRLRQRSKIPLKERPRPKDRAKPVESAAQGPTKERPRVEFKTKAAQSGAAPEPTRQLRPDAIQPAGQSERPRRQTGNVPKRRATPAIKERAMPAIKERVTPAMKERATQGEALTVRYSGQRPAHLPEARASTNPAPQAVEPKGTPRRIAPASQTVEPKAMPQQATPAPECRGPAERQFHARRPPSREPVTRSPELSTPLPGQGRPISRSGKTPRPQGSTKTAVPFRERTRTIFKTRSGPAVKPSAPAVKGKPPAARAAKKAAGQTARRQMRQRMVAQARKAAKAGATAAKKVAEAAVRAVAALVSGLAGLLGGGVLLVILIFIVAIAAIASSPFGIFFSGGGGTGGSGVPTVSVSEAVGSVNMAYNAKLSELQAGGYDSVTLAGQAADWPDVLAAFAFRYAAAVDGVDVATLDADRVSKLTDTFWDMTEIETEVETIPHSDGEGGSWTKRILHITITPKTAEEMKTAYSFTGLQASALDELLADPAALASLAESLEITNTEAESALDALPEELSPDRKRVVETALQLVGKVNYFWGGKSYAIGWDSRWGQLAKVTAEGSSITGTYRPYGLDCTGFIDWTLRNAGLPSDGHWYVGTNLTEVTQASALPGDIALYDDASHVGIVVGRNSAGRLLICHCSSGQNNVVVTEFAAAGFTVLGRPGIYTA